MRRAATCAFAHRSKFPYGPLCARARALGENGDAQALTAAQKEFVQAGVLTGQKISEKYVSRRRRRILPSCSCRPKGYAEVIRLGLVDRLQSKYRVMVTGPSTLGAFLTSLQTGFRTLAIREHSAAIEEMLAAVRAELKRLAICCKRQKLACRCPEPLRVRAEAVHPHPDPAGGRGYI